MLSLFISPTQRMTLFYSLTQFTLIRSIQHNHHIYTYLPKPTFHFYKKTLYFHLIV
ncbi:hypothetical protein HG66A1_19250 [Gimesia chilikensis]|uniref:Uncharacterized protein n=1 Tax=Gimesia chilikensis TaxID=2605989 RepID=A0A517PL84_9PLAN|nr:hypothetical protein HG66A1_19250 [Gimesia chilikensis]